MGGRYAAAVLRSGPAPTGPFDVAVVGAGAVGCAVAREPNIGPGAEGALEIPGEGIVCPFTAVLAFATEAVGAGCELALNAAVEGVRPSGGGHEIETARGQIRAEHLVNAAGLHSDEV